MKLTNIHQFCQKEWKLKSFKNFLCSLNDKNELIVHKRALKQALNYGLVFQKVHRVIKFNEEA